MSPRVRPWASAVILLLLAACGGGGGGSSPTTQPAHVDPVPIDPAPLPPNTFANPDAVDPTASFRALALPAHPDFTIAADVPGTPVTVLHPMVGADAPPAPADLLPMARRAAHLWTRRMDLVGTHDVDLIIGTGPGQDPCGATPHAAACAAYGGQLTPHLVGPNIHIYQNARIGLPDAFLSSNRDTLSAFQFAALVHEVGHTLNYRDTRGEVHPDCSRSLQIMCPTATPHLIAPTPADFAGLRVAITAPLDHQDFGLWAEAPGVAGLDRFGITLTRTVAVTDRIRGQGNPAAADLLTDTVAIDAYVNGTPSAGPAPATGAATWSGPFLGAHTRLFQPVTGDATLTADLADLATIDLALTALQRTGPDGATHALASRNYTLGRQGDTWSAPAGTATAGFHAHGTDPAAAAAGTVQDPSASLIGAWGGVRD